MEIVELNYHRTAIEYNERFKQTFDTQYLMYKIEKLLSSVNLFIA